MSQNVFKASGVEALLEEEYPVVGPGNGVPGNVVVLNDQFRAGEGIHDILSGHFYRGKLPPRQEGVSGHSLPPEPFAGSLTIVDTSGLSSGGEPWEAFCEKQAYSIQDFCERLHQDGFIVDGRSLGVLTHRKDRVMKLQSAIAGVGDVFVDTIHRAQGTERQMIVLDIPDAPGMVKSGEVFGIRNWNHTGAKLFNVALSRAKEHLVVFAHLDYLKEVLPERDLLRSILYEMGQEGVVLEAEEILKLESSGYYMASDAEKKIMADLELAKESITIYSGFVTHKRVSAYAGLFREKIQNKVAVRCVTRPPSGNGSIQRGEAHKALELLQEIGVIVDLRRDIHEKAIIIDGAILWVGSMNPLSFAGGTSELMNRKYDPRSAQRVASQLALWPSLPPGQPENPPCGKCGSLTVYSEGLQGSSFECERRCGPRQMCEK